MPSGRRYHDAAVVRCNVNFGDPHIQAYCSVMHGDRLVTQYDDAAIKVYVEIAQPNSTTR